MVKAIAMGANMYTKKNEKKLKSYSIPIEIDKRAKKNKKRGTAMIRNFFIFHSHYFH